MRRGGRESALQLLYQLDIGGHLDSGTTAQGDRLAAAMRDYWASFEKKMPVDREFAERLVHGVVAHLVDIDATVQEHCAHWRLDRMEKVDRNLLRLGAYEILFCPDIPRAVSINEAVEIAKRFSGAEAATFVNGILDNLPRGSSSEG